MTKVKQNPKVAWNQIDGQVVILETGPSPRFHELNQTASFLWRNIEIQNELSALTKLVVGQFDVSACQAQSDVESFIKELVLLGLLESTSSEDQYPS